MFTDNPRFAVSRAEVHVVEHSHTQAPTNLSDECDLRCRRGDGIAFCDQQSASAFEASLIDAGAHDNGRKIRLTERRERSNRQRACQFFIVFGTSISRLMVVAKVLPMGRGRWASSLHQYVGLTASPEAVAVSHAFRFSRSHLSAAIQSSTYGSGNSRDAKRSVADNVVESLG